MTSSPAEPARGRLLRRVLPIITVLALFSWLALRTPVSPEGAADPRLSEHSFMAMGTVISISLYRQPQQSAAQAQTALQDSERFLRDYEREWSVSGNGALGQLNQALAAGKAADVPAPLQDLFARAAGYSAASGGRFDVRVGNLVRLWGFDDETHYRSTPPSDAEIAAATAAIVAALALNAERYGPAPDVQLDFGAIAKGDAVDLAVARLAAGGFHDVIVNAGGNLRTAGRRGARAWHIGIRHPRPDAGPRLLATLATQGDEAVITSGDYERYFEHGGQRYHHLLDPHSGRPAQGLQSVTVVAANGALADAASTALFVAGPTQWPVVAQALGITQVLVVEADGRVVATPSLLARLQFSDGISAVAAP